MKPDKTKSLKRRLTIQLLLFQIGSLVIVSIAFVAYLSSDGSGSALLSPQAAQITANAIIRDADGPLAVKETREFIKLGDNMPDFWFVAVSEKGEIAQGGPVPEVFSNMNQQLSDTKVSDVRDAALSYSYLAVVRMVRFGTGWRIRHDRQRRSVQHDISHSAVLQHIDHANPRSDVHSHDRDHSVDHPQGVYRSFRHRTGSGKHRYRQARISIAGCRHSKGGATARAGRQRRAATAGRRL
jgi:hypothetical protein